MSKTMKTLVKISLGILGVVAVVATAVAGYLIYPGTPSKASSLIFQGYVVLPSGSVLSILDYLTVKDDELFVTNESTGDVYKVRIRKDSLPTAADVARLPGEPAAHGVLIEPSSHLAFVTRSEANAVDVFEPAKMVLIKRIPVVDDPDAIFYDAFNKLVYVASGDSHLATLKEWLDAALARLPEEQRVTATLAYQMGFSVEEISRIMQSPIGTVKSRMFHARQNLRECVQKKAASKSAAEYRSPGPTNA
jgi:hypothetical protein